MTLKLKYIKEGFAHCILNIIDQEFHVQLQLDEYERYRLKEDEFHIYFSVIKSDYVTPVMEKLDALDKARNHRDTLFNQLDDLTTEKNREIIVDVMKSLNYAIKFMLVDDTERGTCSLNELYSIKKSLQSISNESNREQILKLQVEMEKLVKSIIPEDSEDLNA